MNWSDGARSICLFRSNAVKQSSNLLGAVLAGGRGSRYGGDKSHAVVGGRLLLERAVSTLAEVAVDEVLRACQVLHDDADWGEQAPPAARACSSALIARNLAPDQSEG